MVALVAVSPWAELLLAWSGLGGLARALLVEHQVLVLDPPALLLQIN